MKKPKIGVFGYKGRLGRELVKRENFYPIDCDITNLVELETSAQLRPDFDVVVNCAAMTNVDDCESFFQKAMRINALGVENITETFRNQKLVQISTDYIFSGFQEYSGPYSEVYHPMPINAYGASKYFGEQACGDDDIIVRTTVLYDSFDGENEKGNFVTTLLSRLQNAVAKPIFYTNDGKPLVHLAHVPVDLIGSPTYIPHLAKQIEEVIYMDYSGTINLAGSSVLSRYEFAKKIASKFGFSDKLLVPVEYEKDDSDHADRPRFAGLDVGLSKHLGISQFSVDDGLEDFSKNWKGY